MTTPQSRDLSLKDMGPWKAMCERKGISLEMPGDRRMRRMIRNILQDKDPEFFAPYKLLSTKEFNALSVEALALSGRTDNCLYKHRIVTMGDILKVTIDEFLNMRGFGPHCWQDLYISLYFSGVVSYKNHFVRTKNGETPTEEYV